MQNHGIRTEIGVKNDAITIQAHGYVMYRIVPNIGLPNNTNKITFSTIASDSLANRMTVKAFKTDKVCLESKQENDHTLKLKLTLDTTLNLELIPSNFT